MSYVANLSHYGVPGPHGFKAMDVRDIGLHGIDVGERQRPVDEKKVQELAKSIMEHGQKQPIGVRAKKIHGFELIFGLHRLEAMKLIEREGWDNRASIWATIYPEDYPELRIQMDELVENLHRNELTPAEKAAHQMSYAGLLKKHGKVQAARKKQAKTQSDKKSTDGGLEPHLAVLASNNGQSTIAEKIAADTGIDKDTAHRRHATGQKLAARAGVHVPSLEKATAEELIDGGKAALIAAHEKIDKAKETGKSEARTDAVKPQKRTANHVDLDVIDLPIKLIKWCRKRLKDTDYPLTVEVLKATHQALGELINELENQVLRPDP